jgi:tetratricopeptide (TPR) repeat protein
MYIDRRYRRKRRSPLRYLILLAVIAGGVYLLYTRTNFFESPLNPLKPTPAPTRTLASYLAEAEAFYAEGKLEEAAEAYAVITRLEPENDEAFRWWAKLVALRGHAAEAIKKARQAVKLAPNDARNQAILAMALDWDGQ